MMTHDASDFEPEHFVREPAMCEIEIVEVGAAIEAGLPEPGSMPPRTDAVRR
jgi:hypothetical protein